MKRVGNTLTYYSEEQLARETDLLALAQRFVNDEQIGSDQRVRNLSLFLKPQVYARFIYLHDLYRKIVDVPGSILEFGVHYGASLATLAALQNCYDYFNMSRSVIGFDTFAGFPSVTAGDAENRVGDYGVTDTDKTRLEAILRFVDTLSPHPSVSRFQLVEGDATKTFGPWLAANPQTIVAFAHFDMDLYEPTKAVLELIRPRLVKGSLLVFDELNHPAFPGETLAVIEAFGLNNLALRRHPMQPFAAYAVYGD